MLLLKQQTKIFENEEVLSENRLSENSVSLHTYNYNIVIS